MVSNKATSDYLLSSDHLEMVLKVVRLVIKSSFLPKKSEFPPATQNHMNAQHVTHVLQTVKLVNDGSTNKRTDLAISPALRVTTPKRKKKDVGDDEKQN